MKKEMQMLGEQEHGFLGRRRSLWAVTLLVLGFWSLFGMPSCNQKETPGISGNTNWLKPCVRDADCGTDLLCRCGVCSGACDGTLDCSLPPAEICVSRVGAQGGSGGISTGTAPSGGTPGSLAGGTGGASGGATGIGGEVASGGMAAASQGGSQPGSGGSITTSGGGSAGGTPGTGGSGGDGTSAGGALNTGGAGGSAPIVCGGLTLDGSFVIHNSLDVASIANVGTITGSLQIDAAGLSTIALPTLCSVGTLEELAAPNLTTLDLRGLKTVGNFQVAGAPLATIQLGNLVRAGDLTVIVAGPVDLPELENAGVITLSGSSSFTAPKLKTALGLVINSGTSVDVPALTDVGALGLALSAAAVNFPALTRVSARLDIVGTGTGQSFSFPALTTFVDASIGIPGGSFSAALAKTAADLYLTGLKSVLLPALETITGRLTIDLGDQASVSLPGLETITGGLSVGGTIPTLNLPKLTSVGLDINIQATGIGQSFSFPALGALGTPLINIPAGSFSAALAKTAGALNLTGLKNVSLPALETITGGLSIDLGDQASVLLSSLKTITSGLSVAGTLPTFVLPKLTSIGLDINIQATGTGQSFSMPLLASNIQAFSYTAAASSTANFGQMPSIAGNFTVAVGAAAMSFPKLATIGGDASIHTGTGMFVLPELILITGNLNLVPEAASISFPKLKSVYNMASIVGTGDSSQVISLGGLESLVYMGDFRSTAPLEVTLAGKFSAPALKSTWNGLIIGGVSDLDLSSLQFSGDYSAPCFYGGLQLRNLHMSSVSLPSLQRSCLTVGEWRADEDTCLTGRSANLTLQQIVAPQLTSGGLAFFSNPAFPQCRMDALAAQMSLESFWGNIHESPIKYTFCPVTASGPCP